MDLSSENDDPMDEDHKEFRYHLEHEQDNIETSHQNGRKGSSTTGDFIQDRLLEKLLQRISITEDLPISPDHHGFHINSTTRRSFSLPQMSSNFQRFNSRIGVLFSVQRKIRKILSWESPSQTISILAVYSLVCIETHLINILPIIVILILFADAYAKRYPSSFTLAHKCQNLILNEPVVSTPKNKPIKERSRKFFRNLRNVQNIMDDYARFHDHIAQKFPPLISFSDEVLSSNLFIVFFFALFFILSVSHLIPWRLIFLISGWTTTCINHPFIYRKTLTEAEHLVIPKKSTYLEFLNRFFANNRLLSPSENREVEIFELQFRSSAGEWEPWLFSRTPYTSSLKAQARVKPPKGTRFFEDVQPPPGWEWTEMKWTLDILSDEWVEERNITGVEVEIEGERWVYDIRYESENESKVAEMGSKEENHEKAKQKLCLYWEEGINSENIDKRRDEWRRRRWVRTVRRKRPANIPSAPTESSTI